MPDLRLKNPALVEADTISPLKRMMCGFKSDLVEISDKQQLMEMEMAKLCARHTHN